MEALAIGDLHFDGTLEQYIPDLHEAIRKDVQRIFDWGRKRGISRVFFLGDLCHNPEMSARATKSLIRLFHENQDLKIEVIPGNHDMFSEDPKDGFSLEVIHQVIKYGGLPHVRIHTKPVVKKIDGALVNFLPWPHRSFSKEALNIGHLECKGAKSDSGRLFKSDDLYDGRAVTIMGHLHTRQRIRNTYYPGSPCQTNFGEQKEKFFAHVVWNGSDDYEIRDIPFKPTYVLHNVQIQTKSDLKTIPTDSTDLVKLIVADGAKVGPHHWIDLPNVVKINPYKTSEELVMALTEDLQSGSELRISTDEFFAHWMEQAPDKPKLKKKAATLRSKLLKK